MKRTNNKSIFKKKNTEKAHNRRKHETRRHQSQNKEKEVGVLSHNTRLSCRATSAARHCGCYEFTWVSKVAGETHGRKLQDT